MAHATVTFLEASSTGTDLHRLAGAFLAGYRSPLTRDAYSGDLRRWFDWCRTYQLDPLAVNRTHIEAFLRSLEGEGLAPATVSRRLSTLKAWHGWLYDEEILDGNPAGRVKLPPVVNKQMPAMDRHQAHRFVTTAHETLDVQRRACLVTMIATGLRVTEACNADVGDVSQDRWTWHLDVAAKGGKLHRVTLVPMALSAIDAALEQRSRPGSGPLFVNTQGRRLTRQAVQRAIASVCNAADLPGMTTHSLRRTYIRAALAADVPLRRVQQAVGHSSPETTARYDTQTLAPEKSPAWTVQSAIA